MATRVTNGTRRTTPSLGAPATPAQGPAIRQLIKEIQDNPTLRLDLKTALGLTGIGT